MPVLWDLCRCRRTRYSVQPNVRDEADGDEVDNHADTNGRPLPSASRRLVRVTHNLYQRWLLEQLAGNGSRTAGREMERRGMDYRASPSAVNLLFVNRVTIVTSMR